MRLEEKRDEIDLVDDSIVVLLNRRAELVAEIALIKLSAGLPITDAQREELVVERVAESAAEMNQDATRRTFRTILTESRKIQARVQAEMTADGVIL